MHGRLTLTGSKREGAVLGIDVKIDGHEQHQVTGIFHIDTACAIDVADALDLAEFLAQSVRHRQVIAFPARGGLVDQQIRTDCLCHPGIHGALKTRDHDRDADHHGKTGEQGGSRYRTTP